MSSKGSSKTVIEEVEWECRPEFIYGGPFIAPVKIEPFWNTGTPFNSKLQGTFKKSQAYRSLKDRMPVILTKIIDYLSRDSSKIKSSYNANDGDISTLLQYVTKLKNDVVTNKNYEPLAADTPDAKKWNGWIEAQTQSRYFLNSWLFTECYIYRRLKDGCELTKTLQSFDPFDAQKEQSLADGLEPMCVVAEKLVPMLQKSDNDKMKADFVTLLKLCLWANRCDLSVSAGEPVKLANPSSDDSKADLIDPLKMVMDLKDKILVDDSAKIVDTVLNRADAMTKAVEGNTVVNKCSCHRLAALAKMPICKEKEDRPPVSSKSSLQSPPAEEQEGEEPKIPCPALMTVPQAVMFDIICDNAGYELFTDLCLGHFLVAQKIVQKVRFHVKAMPWFVSDATPRDIKYTISHNSKAAFFKMITPEPKPDPPEGESNAAEEPRTVRAEDLKSLAEQWKQFLDDGTFVILAEDYWTWPHGYKEMKQLDFNLYRKLQFGCASLFKGDLNYRKLVGDKKVNPCMGFEPALEGFIPAPVIAVRTVKSEVICGLPKGKFQQIAAIDEQWMEKGEYGVIQICTKAEPVKPSDRPCADYGTTCFGTVCPAHSDI